MDRLEHTQGGVHPTLETTWSCILEKKLLISKKFKLSFLSMWVGKLQLNFLSPSSFSHIPSVVAATNADSNHKTTKTWRSLFSSPDSIPFHQITTSAISLSVATICNGEQALPRLSRRLWFVIQLLFDTFVWCFLWPYMLDQTSVSVYLLIDSSESWMESSCMWFREEHNEK